MAPNPPTTTVESPLLTPQEEENPADRALDEGIVDGLVVVLYENERPPKGLAGLIDWRTHGLFSRAIRAGSITGKSGECAYFPYRRRERVLHFLVIGGGQLSRNARRSSLPDESFRVLGRNLRTLGLKKLGISKADVGGGTLSEEALRAKLGDASFVLVP